MEILPLISFTTGVISILSPCILPILPIFVGVSLKSKSKTDLISFIAGLLTIFIAVIFLTGFFTTVFYTYIAHVRLISAIILLIVGILMLSDYQFSFKSISNMNRESNYLMGVITSIAWAPCYTGYLISLITLLVSSNDPAYAVLNIIIYCIGFALTLFVLSYFISKIDLEKLILKTKYIPKIFAVLVIIGAVYLLYEAVKVLV
ncbi:MAG: cytochrome c biogenesis protein CcdA [Methanobrevibacter thaueri]|jgi:cytochrome c-type biogenesis protein|uniref:cytochrome c biogenesis CcdA family protein n=1 Tax=Methanobrevibacter thaueri TaxID=190975 RepID=UPI0026EBC881|nr:cytochrome c biogenesis CcdA family protein [Methanobrevibacter thaueri]MBE6496540.1 cytochrome c biogenesis protein CcdA [Methanobrevibacter thaueri]